MFKRRRQTRKLIQVARMLRELDAAATRPVSNHRRARLMLGRS